MKVYMFSCNIIAYHVQLRSDNNLFYYEFNCIINLILQKKQIDYNKNYMSLCAYTFGKSGFMIHTQLTLTRFTKAKI